MSSRAPVENESGLENETENSSSIGRSSGDRLRLLHNDNDSSGNRENVEPRRSWVQQLKRFVSGGGPPEHSLRQTSSLNNVIVISNADGSASNTPFSGTDAPTVSFNRTNSVAVSDSQNQNSFFIRNPIQMIHQVLSEQRLGQHEGSGGVEVAGAHSRKGSWIRAGSRMSRVASRSDQPVCMICFEPLLSEDFDSGEAIQLDCSCKGDVAMRHQSCAIRWSKVKGDNICDICKQPILNIPTPSHSAASSEAGDGAGDNNEGARPGPADYIFDCIRVSWVAMIICILFLNFNLSKAFLSGVIVGLVYMLFCKAINTLHLRAFLMSQNAENLEGQGQEQGEGDAEGGQAQIQNNNINNVNNANGVQPQIPVNILV